VYVDFDVQNKSQFLILENDFFVFVAQGARACERLAVSMGMRLVASHDAKGSIISHSVVSCFG
jgi:hypothetical protein